ncbi:unnamed protein product [Symbiodinium natans]|uniref:Uncharacterized protein n=1 Tax=Symbiodinium natans TaxID=878477 RepID=A0A812HDM7_9DINO|nr:unnamed protein product [Symbiodinium natans]
MRRHGLDYIVLNVFFYVVLEFLSCGEKFSGGGEFEWVGLVVVSLKQRSLEVSERCAAWLIKWLDTTVSSGHARVADLRAVLGRLSFALTALGHLRPFLRPLYARIAVLPNAGRTQCSVGTNNLGSTHVVARLLSTSFLLCAFLMELATQLQRSGTELRLHWLLQNREADALTNGNYAGFTESRRRHFDLQEFKGIVLQELLGVGLTVYAAGCLRQKDPWQ